MEKLGEQKVINYRQRFLDSRNKVFDYELNEYREKSDREEFESDCRGSERLKTI